MILDYRLVYDYVGTTYFMIKDQCSSIVFDRTSLILFGFKNNIKMLTDDVTEKISERIS